MSTDNFLSNTGFRISSGSWKVIDDTINGKAVKAIECQTAGIAYLLFENLNEMTACAGHEDTMYRTLKRVTPG